MDAGVALPEALAHLQVMAKMYECNMRDFTVWLHEETNTMFHQFVYVGSDFDEDMKKCGSDPIVRCYRLTPRVSLQDSHYILNKSPLCQILVDFLRALPRAATLGGTPTLTGGKWGPSVC